jgi:hypothetical protein
MKFYISLPEPALARGPIAGLSFTANGGEAFAEQLQAALADPAYVQRWLATLDPDAREHVDAAMLAVDVKSKVDYGLHGLGFQLIANTQLNGAAFKHRMRLLAGSHWQLTDVK